MEQTLNLAMSAEYDLIAERGRTLNTNITATYIDSGGTEQYFDFTSYSGATLVIKNTAGTIIMTFSTTDGSIILGANGQFSLHKTAEEMLTLRAGCLLYDMYLSSPTYPKRGFLRGKITIEQNIAN